MGRSESIRCFLSHALPTPRAGNIGPVDERRCACERAASTHRLAALGPRVSSEVLFLQLGSLNMRINLRGGDIGMTQHFLDGSQVGTTL